MHLPGRQIFTIWWLVWVSAEASKPISVQVHRQWVDAFNKHVHAHVPLVAIDEERFAQEFLNDTLAARLQNLAGREGAVEKSVGNLCLLRRT